MNRVELLICSSIEEYRAEYMNLYVTGEPLYFYDISVTFIDKDFDHIFSEPDGKGNRNFSKRRAKRIFFMQALLSLPLNIEIMFEEDRGTIALFCLDLECVMYLRIRQGSGRLQVGSFFDFGENHTKMYEKQKRKCTPITIEEIKQKL